MTGKERLFLLLLILLRTAIGWHFLTEAYEKFRSDYIPGPSETVRPWSSEVYFREGTGPLAKMVRNKIGDTDDLLLARLTVKTIPMGNETASFPPYTRMPDLLDQEWNEYLQRFAAWYELSPEQRDAAQEHLQDEKSRTVTWFLTKPKSIDWFLAGLWMNLDEKPLKHTIATANGAVDVNTSIANLTNEYRNKLQEYRDDQGPTLSLFGKDVEKTRRTALRSEIASLRLELQGAVDERSTDMQKDLQSVLTPEQRAKGAVPAPPVRERRLAFFIKDHQAEHPRLIQMIDVTTIFGLMAIGICMLLGLFSRTASFCGALFLLMTILTWPSLPWLPAPPVTEGNYLFVNKNMIEMLALLLLTCIPTGRIFGLDALIQVILRKKETP